MAAYISLTSRTTGHTYTGPSLVQLDQLIAIHLGIPCDPTEWTLNWLNGIGFSIAVRDSWDKIRADHRANLDPLCVALIDYLEAEYENTSYYSR